MENYHFEYPERRERCGPDPLLEWAEARPLRGLLKFIWDAYAGVCFGTMLFGRRLRDGERLLLQYFHIELVLSADWLERAGITTPDQLRDAAQKANTEFRKDNPEFARSKAMEVHQALLETFGDTFKRTSPVLDLFEGVVDAYARKLSPEDAKDVWGQFKPANLALVDEAGRKLVGSAARRARSMLRGSLPPGYDMPLDQAIEAALAVFAENLDKYIIPGRKKSSRGRAKKAGTVGLRWRLGEMFGPRLMYDALARLRGQIKQPPDPVLGPTAARGGSAVPVESFAADDVVLPKTRERRRRRGPHKYLGRDTLSALGVCEPDHLAARLPGDLAAVHEAARQVEAAGKRVTVRAVAERLGLHPGNVSRRLKKIREFLSKRE